MDEPNKRKRVVCPVTSKDGKTYWMKMGSAYVNRDSSINLYLDCLPVNGRLQVREWDDLPWEKREGADGQRSPRQLEPERQEGMPF